MAGASVCVDCAEIEANKQSDDDSDNAMTDDDAFYEDENDFQADQNKTLREELDDLKLHSELSGHIAAPPPK